MKSSIPVLLLLFGWIASFGNCDRSYRIIEKTNNNGKPGQEDEQCMAEIRQACGASECCRKLFQLQKSQGDEKHVSKMEDEYSNTDEIPDGDDDEEENQSGPPSFTNDYPDKRGAFMKADAEDCEKPKVKGPCMAVHRRFYYDSKSQSCKTFTYGGCLGNDNNFQTKDECELTCMSQN